MRSPSLNSITESGTDLITEVILGFLLAHENSVRNNGTMEAFQNVYLCTSDQLAETGGERPHKMKSPQRPFLTTP